MPEPDVEPKVAPIDEKPKKTKEIKEKKMKKSATSNGLGSFARGKLVLARINMLDGTVNDISIEVSSEKINIGNLFVLLLLINVYNLL